MKSLLNLLKVTCVLFLVTSCSTDNIEEDIALNENLIIPEAKVIEIEILELINAYRIDQGFTVLANNDLVKGQAYGHTDYMIANDNVSHDNFFARKSFLTNYVGAQVVSENVAYGYTNAQSVVNAWLNSEGHRENIEGDYSHFEISAEQNEQGKWYFTNIFIKR